MYGMTDLQWAIAFGALCACWLYVALKTTIPRSEDTHDPDPDPIDDTTPGSHPSA